MAGKLILVPHWLLKEVVFDLAAKKGRAQHKDVQWKDKILARYGIVCTVALPFTSSDTVTLVFTQKEPLCTSVPVRSFQLEKFGYSDEYGEGRTKGNICFFELTDLLMWLDIADTVRMELEIDSSESGVN